MAWRVHEEKTDHFVVHGNAGPFRISKGALSTGSIEKMRAMCKGGAVRKAGGGEVKPQPQVNVGTAPTPKDNPEATKKVLAGVQNIVSPKAMAKGGPVDAGPETGGETPSPEEVQQARFSAEDVRQKEANRKGASAPGQVFSEALESVQDPEYVAKKHAEEGAAQARRAAAPAAGELAPGAPGSGAGAPALDTTTQVREPTGMDLPPMPPEADWDKAQKQLDTALKEGQQGADIQAKAEGQKSNEVLAYTDQYQKGLKSLEAKRQADTTAAQTQIDRMVQDFSDPKNDIKPDHFWSSKSAWQKAKAGIGMILAGMGSGLTGQPNLAVEFIGRQIAQDIEAQKTNLGKKADAIGWAYKKYGNIQDASRAAAGFLASSLAAEVGMAGARSGSLEAQGKAQLLKSQLTAAALGAQSQIITGRHQDALLRYQLQFQRSFFSKFGMAPPEPGYVPSGTQPPIPTELTLKGISEQSKAKGEMRVNLPELGPDSHTYAPPKVAEEVNKVLPEYLTMDRNVNILASLGKKHAVAINAPWPNQDNQQFVIAQKALNLSMNKLMELQRFTHEEQKLYGPMIANPRTFLFGKAGEANIRAMKSLIQRHRVQEYQRLGMKLGQRPQETPIASAEKAE